MIISRYKLLSSLMCIAVVVISTGIYSEIPYSQYASIVLCSIIIITNKFACSLFFRTVSRKILFSVALSLFYFVVILYSGWSFKAAVTPTLSLFTFVFMYGIISVSLSRSTEYTVVLLKYTIFGCLVLILFGQWLQSIGLVLTSQVQLSFEQLQWFDRYGAFLNANQTGHIVIMLLYSYFILIESKKDFLFLMLVLIIALIILITINSRATYLYFLLLVVYFFKEKQQYLNTNFVIMSIVMLVFLIILVPFLDYDFERIWIRLDLDVVSGSRFRLLDFSVDAIVRRPLVGSGYRYVQSVMGASSHNEIIENWVNFGLFGLLAVSFFSFGIYRGHHWFAYFVFSLPILFSHNFFDQPSIQVAVALVLSMGELEKLRHRHE